MRIALTTSVVQRGRSGVGQYVLSLVRALLPMARRHEFSLYVLEDDLPLFAFAEGSMRLIPVSETHRPPVRDILWHQAILPDLLIRSGIDVLHVPSYRRMLWRRPCALVATIHDLAPFRLAGKYDRARMFYGRVVARKLAQRQDQIIAVSRLTADDIVHYFGIQPEQVTVVPNGLDHGRFQPGAADHSEARGPSLARGIDSPFFLYVARFEHPAKNHVRLIQAFERVRANGVPWKLVLGGGDWHGSEAIHARIDASPQKAHIHRLGFIAPDQLPGWYRSAGALAFPSLYEGFGLPVAEAMACGCPVLSSLRGGLAEVAGTAALPLEPEDSLQMADQMTRIARDPSLARSLREAGLAQARRFDWGAVADATLGIYARAASTARTQAAAPAAASLPTLPR